MAEVQLGEYIKLLALERGIPIARLLRMAHVSEQMYYRTISGQSFMSRAPLERIINALSPADNPLDDAQQVMILRLYVEARMRKEIGSDSQLVTEIYEIGRAIAFFEVYCEAQNPTE